MILKQPGINCEALNHVARKHTAEIITILRQNTQQNKKRGGLSETAP